MKVVKGNIFDLAEQGLFDVVVHGCNCFCSMGKGIAKEVKGRYPWIYEEDLRTQKGDKNKLGTVGIPDGVDYANHTFHVINAYTQYTYRGATGTVNADYEAIRSCFRHVRKWAHGKRIAYPLIGAGLAKGDWKLISAIIDEELAGEDHTLVLFEQ